MGQSIAHSDPPERRTILRRFLIALEGALVASAAGDKSIAAPLGEFARLTRSIDATSGWPDRKISPERLPVCRFWESVLDAAVGGPAEPLIPALRQLAPALSCPQNPTYRHHLPGPGHRDKSRYAA